MSDDWRQFYRKPDEPDIKVGDAIDGMAKDRSGKWRGIVSHVEAVELVSTEPDGSRIFALKLGDPIFVEDGETQRQ